MQAVGKTPYQVIPSKCSVPGGVAACGGSAGKSISIQPSSAIVHERSPLRVWNGAFPPRTWVAARVACPQTSTFTVGVNHRRS